jgi:outer membrane protein OmpA-like peptidoglycan-associated protein
LKFLAIFLLAAWLANVLRAPDKAPEIFAVLPAPDGQVRDMFGSTLDALPGVATSFTLYFVEGKDELTPESQAQLDSVFAELQRRPLPDIVVIGHTDTVGSLDFNDKLSRARADRMRELLIERGLPAERIEAAGRGKRELLVPTDDNISEPRNRRVEINVR